MKPTKLILLSLVSLYFFSCKKRNEDCARCPIVNTLNFYKGFKGDTIRLVGKNFSPDLHSNIVRFNDVEVPAADMISGNTVQLTVRVPANCGTGPVTVSIDDLNSAPGPIFTMEYASMSGFSPEEGFKGDTITIKGNEFATALNIVKFNGMKATVIFESDTLIQAIVPVTCGTGMITITLPNGLIIKNPSEFTYNYTYHVSTFAGIPKTEGNQDGALNTATFKNLLGLTLDYKSNSIYVSDANCIRKIYNAQVSTFAGEQLVSGFLNGYGKSARLSTPGDLAINNGELYVADQNNHCIRKVTANGYTSVYIGTATQAGDVDGKGGTALLQGPSSIKSFNDSVFYIADFMNSKLKRCNKKTEVKTAPLNAPFTCSNITVKDDHALLGADAAHNQIMKIDVSTSDMSIFAGTGINGSTDGDALSASFSEPSAIAVRSIGSRQEIYISDKGGHTIRFIDSKNKVRTVMGSTQGYADGENKDALFDSPVNLAFNPAKNNILYILDAGNKIIRKVTID